MLYNHSGCTKRRDRIGEPGSLVLCGTQAVQQCLSIKLTSSSRRAGFDWLINHLSRWL